MKTPETPDQTSPRDGERHRRGVSTELLRAGEWGLVADQLGLSRRESAVAQCLLDGDVEGTIATQLGLSPHTVHSYAWRIYRKARVRSRQELTIRVFGVVRSLGAANGERPS